MLGKTLIFVGDDDTTVVPESQGIALYKALHHRNATTALYHYPGKGYMHSNHGGVKNWDFKGTKDPKEDLKGPPIS